MTDDSHKKRGTVGELIQELGSERAAMNHILAYNIKLRIAAADVLACWKGFKPFMSAAAIDNLQVALNDEENSKEVAPDNCNHCFHDFGVVSNPEKSPSIKKRCCWCGEYSLWTVVERKHGPFDPALEAYND